MTRSTAVVFPFDSFGNSGTGDGARLLGDVLREVIDDTDQEPRPTRQHAFVGSLRVEEVPFETMAELAAWRETGRKIARERLDGGDFLLWLSEECIGIWPGLELTEQYILKLIVHGPSTFGWTLQ